MAVSADRNILWFAALSVFMLLIVSCQAVEQVVVKRPKMTMEEEEAQRRKIDEWTGYVNLIGNNEPSMDTLLRLTDGYFEAKELLYKKDLEDYEEKLARYNKGEIKVKPKQPRQDYGLLIGYFRKLADRYHYGEGADSIRYALGYALYDQGDIGEAIAVFEEITRNYPDSDYLLEVSFRLGEFYFETGQMGVALDNYKRILDHPLSIFYEKGMYKSGWIHYKLDDYGEAVKAFMVVADRTWEGELKKGGLFEESISSMVMTLSHIKDMEKVIELISAEDYRGYTPLVLTNLGDRLIDETRYKDALFVYNKLPELFPDDPGSPFLYEKIAELYDVYMDDDASALGARWNLIKNFNPATDWYKKNYPGGSKEIDDLLSKTMVDISKTYHLRGKKGKSIDDLNMAIEGYRIFLVSFPDSPEVKEMNLLLAEALFDAGRYPEAVMEYEKSAMQYEDVAQRGEIIYSALLTYEIIFSDEASDKGKTVESAKELLDNYRSDVTKSGKLETVLFRISNMYGKIEEYTKAREVIMPLTRLKDPVPAYKRLAELYLLEGNLASAEDSYLNLVRKSDDPVFRDRLSTLRYKMAEEYLKAGEFKEAEDKFDQSFAAHPGGKVGESALMKLGLIYLKNNEIGKLRSIAYKAAKAYPGSGGGAMLFVEAGRDIEKEDPLKAAELYDEASSVSPNPQDAGNLLLAAASIYDEKKKYVKAERLLKRYVGMSGISTEKKADALYRLAEVQLKMEKQDRGIDTLRALLNMKGKVDKQIIVRANLLLLKGRRNTYLNVKLTQPFEKTLMEKTTLLNGLLKDYSALAREKVAILLPEIFFHMGTALEDFRSALIEAERPGDLTPEELDEYKFLLEEKAYPYEEQAVKAYTRSLKIGRKNGVFDEWVEKSLDRLADLRPALYKRGFDEKKLKPLFIRPEIVAFEGGL